MSKVGGPALQGARFVDTSMAAWAFAMSSIDAPRVFMQVAQSTRVDLDTLPPRSLAGISWACAKSAHRDQALFQDISQRAKMVISDFGSHDVAALCWAFAAAHKDNVAAKETHLFETLANHLVVQELVASMSPPLAAELAWAFATVGVWPLPFFQELGTLCAAHISDLET